MMTSFDFENIDLGSPKLHLKIIYGPTYPPNFVFLFNMEAEIAGEHYLPPPPPSSQTLSRERDMPIYVASDAPSTPGQ